MRLPLPALLLSGLPLAAVAATPATPARTPNVIVILADDLGYGDVSCYGRGKIATPAIDRLAAEGMKFTSGYAPASTCTPTRYGVMTGEYAWRKPGTGIIPGDANLIISPSRTTLPRIFKNAGYTTGAVGKWHLGMGDGKIDFNKRIAPGLNEVGFDYAFNMAATGDRVPCVYIENGLVVNLDPADPIRVSYKSRAGRKSTAPAKNAPAGDFEEELIRAEATPYASAHPEMLRMRSNSGHADSLINGIGRIGFMTGGKSARWDDRSLSDTFTAKALDFIRTNKNRPFFLYFAVHEPHVPRDPNPTFVGKSGLGLRADAILQFDATVGKVLETLKAAGIDDNTLIILSSDNGPAVADGYADGAIEAETKGGHDASGGLRGGKYGNFEGGTRVPFLVRWPTRVKAGTVNDTPVSLIDLAATAADLTRQPLAPKDAPDSFSLLPTFTPGGKSAAPFQLFGNPSPDFSPAAIREGRWKLIAGSHAKSGGQLFDLDADPAEKTNLAAKHPEVVKRLQERMHEAARAGHTRPGATKVDIR